MSETPRQESSAQAPEGRSAPAEARSFRRPDDPAAAIAEAAEPLPPIEDPAFAAMFDRFAEARVVLLGEASHGTSEFYRARAAITHRLVRVHGFRIIAVEADWPDAAQVDRHIRGLPRNPNAPPPFQRFPTWMWRNAEIDRFTAELRAWNLGRPETDQVGFHGLDLYNLAGSMRAVIDYLERIDPGAARVARQRYGCLEPWSQDPAVYGHLAARSGYAHCEAGVVDMLRDLLARQLDYARHDGRGFLDAAQNARLVANAEAYYRAMYRGAAESWNLRDTHMFETLQALLAAGGPKSKAVVWAHNSHIGDAAFTEMGRLRGELNIGRLCRAAFQDEAKLIGFGTHGGTVACASDWDGPMEVKPIRPALPDSCEALAHAAGLPRFLLDPARDPATRRALTEPRLQRFIGVIYRPQTERLSHYAEAALAGQFDAYAWIDETSAVTPLPGPQAQGAEDTWPFGL